MRNGSNSISTGEMKSRGTGIAHPGTNAGTRVKLAEMVPLSGKAPPPAAKVERFHNSVRINRAMALAATRVPPPLLLSYFT
jgi:hypothetical protein